MAVEILLIDMGKGKLAKFADMAEYPHVFEYPYSVVDEVNFEMKGSWNRDFFKNDNPIVLELGCGRGEYTVGLARRYPDKNFIGVDIKGARMWTGATEALNEGLKHCSYELVARMDTDDICKPERFAKQVAFMEKHPEVDVVGAWIDEFQGDTSHVSSTRKLPEASEEIVAFGKKRNPMNHPVVMFRKSAVEAVGSYLPFYLFEDYYLWVRMLLNGATFYNIQESLLYFRLSPKMFKRRGGLKYACVEISFLWKLYCLGYTSFVTTCMNICIRIAARIIPNSLRSWVYKKMLRN